MTHTIKTHSNDFQAKPTKVLILKPKPLCKLTRHLLTWLTYLDTNTHHAGQTTHPDSCNTNTYSNGYWIRPIKIQILKSKPQSKLTKQKHTANHKRHTTSPTQWGHRRRVTKLMQTTVRHTWIKKLVRKCDITHPTDAYNIKQLTHLDLSLIHI